MLYTYTGDCCLQENAYVAMTEYNADHCLHESCVAMTEAAPQDVKRRSQMHSIDAED